MNTGAHQNKAAADHRASIDTDRYRLRNFVAQLAQAGELQTVDHNVDLIDIARTLDGNAKAVLFRSAGSEKAELIGNVIGSRSRLALGFGVSERELLFEILRRYQNPIPPVEVPRTSAPVQDIVLTGDDADFMKLPIHLQHDADGGIYISASIDFTQSEDGTERNVGYRRMMIRGRKEAGIDLLAPSDLRASYGRRVAEGKCMPIAFVIGSHPVDSVAAVSTLPLRDEIALMGAMRQAPVPIVKCVTCDVMVPADAEIVLEGYLDEKGWCEPEGPYGEYLGYYGHMKTNPVFHLTAITMRRDALFQTATISGRALGQTDTALLTALRSEGAIWNALKASVREPVAVYCPPSTGGMFNARISLRQRYPGEARNAIAAAFGSTADTKHVFVTDDDINIFSDEEFEWAFATRFQAGRDLILASGFRAMPLDPSLAGSRTGDKAGFDLTFPFGWQTSGDFRIPVPPEPGSTPPVSVRQALESGPKTFGALMQATGSRDGRDTTLELDALRQQGLIERTPEGAFSLKTRD